MIDDLDCLLSAGLRVIILVFGCTDTLPYRRCEYALKSFTYIPLPLPDVYTSLVINILGHG
jgi:hypothetical protein